MNAATIRAQLQLFQSRDVFLAIIPRLVLFYRSDNVFPRNCLHPGEKVTRVDAR